MDAHSIEVDHDAADIRGAHGHHGEEPVLPPPEQRHALVKHKQVLEALRDVRGDREQLA